MKDKKKSSRNYVEDRLVSLRNLKEQYLLQSKAAEWKVKANMKEVEAPGEGDYRTQISSVVKLQKDADFASAMPEYEFIPENEAGRKNRRIVREAWNYWWKKSGSDKEVSKAAQSSTTYGTGIIYEGIKHIYKKVNEPFLNESNEIEFKEERKLVYSGIYTKKIPFENFFINGDDIDNATECIVIEYYDMDGYIAEKKENGIYKNLTKLSNTTKGYSLAGNTSGEDVTADGDEDNTVTELTYYNVAKDEYIIVANGIEILKSHIPYEHKELPFALFYDNVAEDRIWGIGEYELTEQDERTKNELRSLLLQGIKSSLGFILTERDNEFEEDDMFFGVGQKYEVGEIDGIKHFAPTVPVQAISEAERKIDNDIIIKTGMDINSLQTTSESATKTAGKSVSSKKRINKNIKDNAYGFYKRLAYLRLKNIQFLHKMKIIEIPIKGGTIQNDGIFRKDDINAFGSAKIGGDLIEGDFMVEPLIDSMTGDNKIRRKTNALEYAQVGGSIVGSDGKPVIKGEALGELLSEEFGYDHDKMTQEASVNRGGQEILDNMDKADSGVSTDATNPNSPDFIPPEQRSGASNNVATISGQAKISAEELLAE